MIKTVKNIVNILIRTPKTLFLIDSLGALFTALMLFGVLRNFNEYFGMSKEILTYLSAIAVCFCIYSAVCYLFLKKHYTPFIRVIGIANILYCILTMGLLIVYYPLLTTIGITYFLVEMTIVCGLVYIELNVATAIKNDI